MVHCSFFSQKLWRSELIAVQFLFFFANLKSTVFIIEWKFEENSSECFLVQGKYLISEQGKGKSIERKASFEKSVRFRFSTNCVIFLPTSRTISIKCDIY